jgi:5-methyltetrahydrofolate--homocysteine methyltransferase
VTLVQDVFTAVVDGDQAGIEGLVAQALEAGAGPQTVLDDGLIAAMTEVGARFERGEYFISDMLVSARAMKAAMACLQPHLVSKAVEPVGVVVIGTVQGDLHDIGKNLVAVMLQGAGFRVVDLGVDVPAERYVRAAQECGADLVALSGLLTTTMPTMQATVAALRQAGLDQVKVIVGGAPISQDFADLIGADGFAPDAAVAAAKARALVGA